MDAWVKLSTLSVEPRITLNVIHEWTHIDFEVAAKNLTNWSIQT